MKIRSKAPAGGDGLAAAVLADLERLGITPEVNPLTGRGNLRRHVLGVARRRLSPLSLRREERFDDELPEVSGLILKDGAKHRTVMANVLEQLTSDTEAAPRLPELLRRRAHREPAGSRGLLRATRLDSSRRRAHRAGA